MIYFEKYHGTGNDFIIMNGLSEVNYDYSELSKKICDRHFGVGADGFMVVEHSDVSDIKMRFYNADGSEAPMCGNGIRCFAKYVFDHKIVDKRVFQVETLGGIMKVELINENVRINLGKPVLNTKEIPIITDKEQYIEEKMQIDEYVFKISVINLGTIHSVIFIDSLDLIDIKRVGSLIEIHKMFPKRTNVNFCQVIDENNIKVITWERGVGITLACGTGSAATAVLSSILKNTNRKVNVHVPGGILEIDQENDQVYLIGGADLICTGQYKN